MRSPSTIAFLLADLVLWKPALFGAKPEMVIKGGTIAWAQMGDPNASIPTPQPVVMRPMFGSFGKAVGGTSVAFVSAAAKAAGVKEAYGLQRAVEPVVGTRALGKSDMVLNDAKPAIKVDAETFEVTADGELTELRDVVGSVYIRGCMWTTIQSPSTHPSTCIS